jgi:predicted Ser/Thr protein kinase
LDETRGSALGGGRFGDVYVAWWDGTAVAIKVAAGISEVARAAMQRELRIIQALKAHPHVLTVFGLCSDAPDRKLRVVMELCAHGSLLDWLRGVPVVTAVQTTTIVSQVARGLRHLHNVGIIHRDLAARNVLVADESPLRVKVADFGLSSELGATESARVTSTTIGPVAWRAPETFHLDSNGRQTVSRQTDVYMLGGLMIEILTAGRCAPFFWLSSERLVVQRCTSTVNALDAAEAAGTAYPFTLVVGSDWTGVPDVLQQLKALTARCLHADPLQRPSLDDVIDTVAGIVSGKVWRAADAGYGDGVVDGTQGEYGVGTITYDMTPGVVVGASGGGGTGAVVGVASTASIASVAGGVVGIGAAVEAMDALRIASELIEAVCDRMGFDDVASGDFVRMLLDAGMKKPDVARVCAKLGVVPRAPAVVEAPPVHAPASQDVEPSAVEVTLVPAIDTVAAVSLAAGYPTPASVPHTINNAFATLLALSLASEYKFPLAMEFEEALARGHNDGRVREQKKVGGLSAP